MSGYKFCEKVWRNGEIMALEKATHNLLSSTIHYGIGTTDSVRGYECDDKIFLFRLKDHVRRLFDSSKLYHLKVPFNQQELEKAFVDIARANNIQSDCYIRILLYPGNLPRLGSINALKADIQVSIMANLYPSKLGSEIFEKENLAIVSSWRAIPPDVLPVTSKAIGHYANYFVAGVEAVNKGANTAILLDHNGLVCEGSGANLFIVKNGIVITPHGHASILKGITRDTLIRLIIDLKLEVHERGIPKSELYIADEIFECGTGAEIAPITKVDGIRISNGPGQITRRIAEYFRNVVTGQEKKYSHWLTAI